MTVTLISACRFPAEYHALQWTEQTNVKCPFSFQFFTPFCRRANTSMTAKVHMSSSTSSIFSIINVQTYRERVTVIHADCRCSVTLVELMFSSSRSTIVLAQFLAQNVLN